MSATTAPLLSNWWYRVATRRPKLRSHARLHRHRYRGEVWYLLQDATSSRVHRFTPAARLIIALMDGSRSVAELWQIANTHLGENAPTQDEMIQLLGQLHSADLLQSDVTPDAAELFARGEREETARQRRSYANPMAIRIPLWDPDAFLNRFRRLIRLIWSRGAAVLWLAVVLPAVFLISPHWPELSNNLSDRVFAVENLVALYLVFPVIKLLHELGHATATKAGGGEVHDLGIMLMVLMPVPYVEASAATVFKSKYRRAVIGAAGMAVELFIAAIAFYVWMLIEPGLLRAILFNVMLVASVSTLLFNGNPFLRYDAYYILADLIEIPNLAARSARYWGYVIERYVLRVPEAEPPHASATEKAWFLFYGLVSTIYRLFVTIVIALFIAGQFFIIGVLLALWAVGAMVVFPVVKAFRHFAGNPRMRTHRSRILAITTSIVLGLAGLLLVVPMPYHSHAEGVLWLPEEAVVRAGANGFLSHFLVQPGSAVVRGDELAQSNEPGLISQKRRSEAKVAELQAEYSAEFVKDRAKAQLVHDKIVHEQANLSLLNERVAELVVRAKGNGRFVAQQPGDMPGRYYRKGDPLGYVIGEAPPLARVVISQESVDKVRLATDRVRIRRVDQAQPAWEGKVMREVPAGVEYLPSAALAVEGGGEIAVDPRDTKGPKTLERMFQIDVALDDMIHVTHFGQRVFVRFEHQMEPIAFRIYRNVRLLFLSSFNV
jgi:putative peptide zinc metalloprotease protein